MLLEEEKVSINTTYNSGSKYVILIEYKPPLITNLKEVLAYNISSFPAGEPLLTT